MRGKCSALEPMRRSVSGAAPAVRLTCIAQQRNGRCSQQQRSFRTARRPGVAVRAAQEQHMIITGDIGGTNARLGLWACSADSCSEVLTCCRRERGSAALPHCTLRALGRSRCHGYCNRRGSALYRRCTVRRTPQHSFPPLRTACKPFWMSPGRAAAARLPLPHSPSLVRLKTTAAP